MTSLTLSNVSNAIKRHLKTLARKSATERWSSRLSASRDAMESDASRSQECPAWRSFQSAEITNARKGMKKCITRLQLLPPNVKWPQRQNVMMKSGVSQENQQEKAPMKILLKIKS